MTSVVQQLQVQISDHRNRINAHNQRQKKLTRLVEKEQSFCDRLHVRLSGTAPGTSDHGKISHDLSHNIVYKERRLKRFSNEMAEIEKDLLATTQKMVELEDDLIDAQNRIAADAATDLAERKAEIAASLGVEPSAISDQELLPRE